MEDRFLTDIDESVDRLMVNLSTHGSIIVAFDFDNTIYDYHKVGDTYPEMIHLLQYLSVLQEIKLMLYTAREGEDLSEAIEYCRENSIRLHYVNDNPILATRKPLFSLLLDDRAGLPTAYQIIIKFLHKLNYDYRHKSCPAD